MDNNQTQRENCLVCGTDRPQKEWLEEIYEAQNCRLCSPHCQAKLEADPEHYVPDARTLTRPLGYC